MPGADSFDLDRFVNAQASIFPSALAELRGGQKRGHWMWFVFPQLRGLGHSAMADRYGIASLEEARAYLAHPLLGSRLVLCTAAVMAVEGRSVRAIFGSPDDLKFRSSLTLFARASDQAEDPYRSALDRFWNGEPDPRTLALLDAR